MPNRSWIPNGFTMGSLLCGVLSTMFVMQALADGGNGPVWVWGAACIFLAGLLDGLDGRFARLLNTSSRFGKELDGLTDIISMTLAPALLVYQRTFANDAWNGVWMALTAFFVCCGAARLARFNQEGAPGEAFTGLPTTAACAVMAGFGVLGPQLNPGLIAAGVLLIAALMISTLSFPTPKQFFVGMPLVLKILLATVFLVGAIGGQDWFFATPLIYVFYGVAQNVIAALRGAPMRVRN